MPIDRKDFSQKMDEKLRSAKVNEGVVREVIHAISTEDHVDRPYGPGATDRYLIASYWREVIDRQRFSSKRAHNVRQDIRAT